MFTCLDITFHHCLGPKKIENILKDINFVIIVNLRFGGPSVKVDNFRFQGSQVHQLTIYNNIINECAVVFRFNNTKFGKMVILLIWPKSLIGQLTI